MVIELIIAALFAEIIGTLLGFGSATILLPIALFLMPFETAILLVGVFHLASTALRTLVHYESIKFDIVLWFGVPSLAGALFGALLIPSFNPQLLRICVGAILAAFLIYDVMDARMIVVRNHTAKFLLGSTSGLIGGLSGMGGPFRSASLTAMNLRKDAYLGTIALCAFLVDLVRVPTYVMQGFPIDWALALTLGIVAVVGVFIANRIVHRLNNHYFRLSVLFGLFSVALALVADGIRLLIG